MDSHAAGQAVLPVSRAQHAARADLRVQTIQGSSDGGRYGDVIEEIDWSVGRVMAASSWPSLIPTHSSSSPATMARGMFGPHGGTAGPLRGEKGTSWEGGYRVPGIFHWPGKIEPATVPGMAANLDLYATFATLTGGQQPQGRPAIGLLISPRPSCEVSPAREHTGSFRVARKHFDRGIIKSTSAPGSFLSSRHTST